MRRIAIFLFFILLVMESEHYLVKLDGHLKAGRDSFIGKNAFVVMVERLTHTPYLYALKYGWYQEMRETSIINCNISGVKSSNLKDKMNLTGDTIGSVSGQDYTGQGLSRPGNLKTVDTRLIYNYVTANLGYFFGRKKY